MTCTKDQEGVVEVLDEAVSVRVEEVEDESEKEKEKHRDVSEVIQDSKGVSLIVLSVFLPLFIALNVDFVDHVVERDGLWTAEEDLFLESSSVHVADEDEPGF